MTIDAHVRALEAHVEQLIESAPESEKGAFSQEMEGFKKLYNFLVDPSRTRTVKWDNIQPPPEELVRPHASLPSCSEEERNALLDKLVVLKLNGGLGTSMGCTGPKSVIEVHSGYTFLDLTVRQIVHLNDTYGCNVPLVLMNSFNTHDDTEQVLSKYKNSNIKIYCFNQHRYPRIWKDSKLPCPTSFDSPKDNWVPPGHGDVFSAFHQSPVFKDLLSQGKEYMFLSNVDNLGATVDLDILKHIADSKAEYLMEVTDKTRADVKGGTLILYEGAIRLLEIAQVPDDHVEEFKSIKKFKIFNTNNLWVNMAAIDRLEKANAMDDMDVIINNKELKGRPIVQLERAAGAAIQYFKNAHGINVPRSRFLPVKGTSDLFIVQSDLYKLRHGSLVRNPQRPFESVPLVKLGETFKKVNQYMSRFKGIPDVLELDHLTISGDVTIGKGVSLRGTVIIVANHGSRIDIPDGAILENKVVSGNLRILDH
eukprot:TRINITY_DN20553_c0_g1_i1.p1 TRINITY_DN20553_c0_g1~~TRINITY_DN20553_c0_g1_i1.p1  ORF type:complete len:514 (-),score=188.05 TRINITY_DN20553_c0_g1_i1:120-1559(-)